MKFDRVMAAAGGVLVSAAMGASALELPYRFSANTRAVAAEVNANFDAIVDTVETLASDVAGALNTAAAALQTAMSASAIAEDAAFAAEAANETADSALDLALAASDSADAAAAAADEALATADEASQSAHDALTQLEAVRETANDALETATSAQNTADRALALAESASQGTAGLALSVSNASGDVVGRIALMLGDDGSWMWSKVGGNYAQIATGDLEGSVSFSGPDCTGTAYIPDSSQGLQTFSNVVEVAAHPGELLIAQAGSVGSYVIQSQFYMDDYVGNGRCNSDMNSSVITAYLATPVSDEERDRFLAAITGPFTVSEQASLNLPDLLVGP